MRFDPPDKVHAIKKINLDLIEIYQYSRDFENNCLSENGKTHYRKILYTIKKIND